MLALLVFAPARWLAALVRQASGGQVVLAAPRGSFWQGSAQLELSGGEGSRDAIALPGALTWRIRPAWNGMTMQLNAECCTQQPMQLTATPAGWGGVQLVVSDSQSNWPAGLLAGLGTPWNTLQVQGELLASTHGFTVQWVQGRLSLAGRLQLDASRVSSRLSTLRPMGSYRLTLLGQWVGQRLRFQGEASATPESVDALSNLLNIIGRRNGATSIIKVG